MSSDPLLEPASNKPIFWTQGSICTQSTMIFSSLASYSHSFSTARLIIRDLLSSRSSFWKLGLWSLQNTSASHKTQSVVWRFWFYTCVHWKGWWSSWVSIGIGERWYKSVEMPKRGNKIWNRLAVAVGLVENCCRRCRWNWVEKVVRSELRAALLVVVSGALPEEHAENIVVLLKLEVFLTISSSVLRPGRLSLRPESIIMLPFFSINQHRIRMWHVLEHVLRAYITKRIP